MTSLRHNLEVLAPAAGPDDAYLDAARATVLAVGWRRTTLTDVARRAGVSRMTLYRRWPDMTGLLGDLMLREWGAVVRGALVDAPTGRRGIATAVVGCVAAIRGDALFRKIVDVDPELLLPYLVERRGRTQDLVLDALAAVLAAAQEDAPDPVRPGDAHLLATGVLLTLHGFLLSAGTMTPDAATLDAELERLIERYLAP